MFEKNKLSVDKIYPSTCPRCLRKLRAQRKKLGRGRKFYSNANPFSSLELLIQSIPGFENGLIFPIILPQRGKMSIELFKISISSRGAILPES